MRGVLGSLGVVEAAVSAVASFASPLSAVAATLAFSCADDNNFSFVMSAFFRDPLVSCECVFTVCGVDVVVVVVDAVADDVVAVVVDAVADDDDVVDGFSLASTGGSNMLPCKLTGSSSSSWYTRQANNCPVVPSRMVVYKGSSSACCALSSLSSSSMVVIISGKYKGKAAKSWLVERLKPP